MKYMSYELYKCPSSPTETGTYVGKTPILEQALQAAERSNNRLFVKGVRENGERVVLI